MMSFGNTEKIEKWIRPSLILYFFATWTSMAGMEIFGWLTFALVMTFAVQQKSKTTYSLDQVLNFLPWQAMLILLLVTILGVFINGTNETDKLFVIGSQRWMFLLLSGTLALALWPPTEKGYRIFLMVASLIAIYAVFQSFTGVDLLRSSSRAVQPLNVDSKLQLWRSAGTFGSPMGYVYIAGMYACLPLAVFLLYPKKYQRLRQFSLLAFALIATSLMTTYVRGAWIGMLFAYLVMTFVINRRYLAITLGSLLAAFSVIFAALEPFRMRVLSLFDPNYASNSDRLFLWRANWEMFKDYPLLGIGYGENETRAGEYVARLGDPEAFTGHAHNNYLQFLAGTGVIGFLSYLFFAGFFLHLTWRLWKSLPLDLYWARALTLAALGAQIHLHVGGFTECNFKAGATSHNFMIVLGLVASMSLLQAHGRLKEKYSQEP